MSNLQQKHYQNACLSCLLPGWLPSNITYPGVPAKHADQISHQLSGTRCEHSLNILLVLSYALLSLAFLLIVFHKEGKHMQLGIFAGIPNDYDLRQT